MNFKTTSTYWCRIFVGTNPGYAKKDVTPVSEERLEEICQEYCDTVGLCVNVSKTKYIYRHGKENGVIVELINYPRFPKTNHDILSHALVLAKILKEEAKQIGVSIMTPDTTILLRDEE